MIPDNLSVFGTAMANHLWQSTLFAALVAMSMLALRKNQARIRHHLWLAASLKFLIPFSLLMSLGSYLARVNGSSESQPVFYFVVRKVSQPFDQSAGPLFAAYLTRWLPELALILWLAGFVTVTGLWWLRWRRVAAAIHDALAISDGREVAALRRVERLAGMRRPIALRLSQSSLEPGAFGIVQPLLLWPAGISKHLEDTHLEAILAHEVQHVRRSDNLAAAMHMLVEAVFWFHPLVWWLGARLVEERERACDEDVLSLGNSPHVYAESILRTCQFCMASPLACVSGVTGSDLKQRIVRIMTHRSADKLSVGRKFVLAGIALGAVTGPVVAGLVNDRVVNAQPPQANAGPPATTVDQEEHAPTTLAALKQKYRVGGEVSEPKLLFAPDPEFTEKARRVKYQGVCVLAVVVDEQGKTTHIRVVRRLGMGLDMKAVEAVRQYKFTPAMMYGKAVPVEVHIEVNFRIH